TNTAPTKQLTLSLPVGIRDAAKTIFEKITCQPESCINQEPIENKIATYYAIVKEPLGLDTQITLEKQAYHTKNVSLPKNADL
ncbi:VOC family protein, partial [Enterococcus faecalis]|nr:VOC family protein [Enterococcus faecalis]